MVFSFAVCVGEKLEGTRELLREGILLIFFFFSFLAKRNDRFQLRGLHEKKIPFCLTIQGHSIQFKIILVLEVQDYQLKN